ncbi:MAG: methyltransferase [Candidatus Cloacimonetes bacterium]|nr:methyltransferase [Candidatus Cloacimonadota bacterium]
MIREVALPFAGKTIRQNTLAQAVSQASAMLVEAAIQSFPNLTLQVLDMGCGCGIVSIMCALSRSEWKITGIDIQPELVALARENAAACELDIDFHCADLREYEGVYDLIVTNPPWQKQGSGLLSPHPQRNLSRVELSCAMPELLQAIRRCLAPQGQAIVIYPQHRLEDLEEASNETSLDIIECHTQSGNKAYFCAKLMIGN